MTSEVKGRVASGEGRIEVAEDKDDRKVSVRAKRVVRVRVTVPR